MLSSPNTNPLPQSAGSPLSSQGSLSSIESTSVSSVLSSASKQFSIPTRWKPNIMMAINPDIRNEIVRDLVTHIYAFCDKPSTGFISKVAKMLVEEYPFMADSSGLSDSLPYVSNYLWGECNVTHSVCKLVIL